MQSLDNSQILEQYTRIKSGGINFYSNYFFKPVSENATGAFGKDSLFFLEPQNGFSRYYFASTNLDELSRITKDSLNKGSVICADYIAKSDMPQAVCDFFNANFLPYAKYAKRTKKLELSNTEAQIFNCEISAEAIYADLLKTFDKYASYFPSFEAIKKAKEENRIIYIGDNSDIKSYIIFEIKGKCAYLNFIANRGGKAALKEIWSKFYSALCAFKAESLYLWVDLANSKAIRMYDIEKFSPPQLFNFIFIAK